MRNDETGKWKKDTLGNYDQPIFKTKSKSSTRSPVFDEAPFVKDIKTGGYEARFEKLGIGSQMYQAMSAKEKERYKQQQEQKALGVLPTKDDSSELKLLFGPPDQEQKQPGQQQQLTLGRNHEVPVYLHDTIMDFKDKLKLAAKKEADFLKPKQGFVDTIDKLNSIDVGNRHLVLVFVAPEKLRQLARETAKVQTHEYSKVYHLARKDPSNWQPLDPLLTFSAYSKAFGFGSGSHVPLLRIVRNTPAYMLKNNLVRRFEEENRRYTEPIDNRDTKVECFAHAMYNHKKR
jgi:hypothetical protein